MHGPSFYVALMSVGELAKGVTYTQSIKTGLDLLLPCLFLELYSTYYSLFFFSWRPPQYIVNSPKSRHDRIRRKWHIITEGEDPPPPVKTFKVLQNYQLLDSARLWFSDCCFVAVHRK